MAGWVWFHRTYLSPATYPVPSGDSLTSEKRGMREKRNQGGQLSLENTVRKLPIESESVIAGRL